MALGGVGTTAFNLSDIELAVVWASLLNIATVLLINDGGNFIVFAGGVHSVFCSVPDWLTQWVLLPRTAVSSTL